MTFLVFQYGLRWQQSAKGMEVIFRFPLNVLCINLTLRQRIEIGASAGIWLIHWLLAFALSLFFPLGVGQLSSPLKNEEIVTPSGELNTNNC